MKKKIVSVIVLVMVLSMSTLSTFAVNMTTLGDEDIDVKAVYNDQVIVPTIYSVDLSWGAMEFTYTASGTKNWDPDNNQYIVSTNAAWTAKGNGITVINHSNIGVTADFAFAALNAYSTVTGSFLNDSISLVAADMEGVTAAELTGTTALTLDGTLDKSIDTLTNIGEITVTIE